MTIEESGTLETAANDQYPRTLVRGEALRQFDSVSSDVEIKNPLIVGAIILVLGAYFYHVNSLSKYLVQCALEEGIHAN